MNDFENLDLNSMDIVEDKKEQLKQVFPEVFTENKIDFEKLKLVLGSEIEASKERYGMTWPGKSDCFKLIQSPSIATLKTARDESINFDTTENIFIEGENLEVLKLLQKSYYGKVKLIYIDPPYNTGNEFIYKDDYKNNLQNYLEYTGQVDANGKKFSTNADTSGRFHTNWINMIYPRLYLAKNLLSEEGVIFISIDDNEVSNLRKICDEIFGEENFIDCIIWKKRYGGGAKEKHLISIHEYVLFYAKNKDYLGELIIPYSKSLIDKYYFLKDEKYEIRGPYRTHPLEAGKAVGERKNLVFAIPAPDGTQIFPKRQWYWSKDRVYEALKKNELEFTKNKTEWTVHTKQYLKDDKGNIREGKAFSIIDDVYTQHGTNEIIDLFGDIQIFPYPKPTGLIKYFLNFATEPQKNNIVLDFFSGSSTTAHTILEMNKEDNGNRKFILIQLPEPTHQESAAFKKGFTTIADIGKERIRRVIKKIKEENQNKLDFGNNLDLGFKVFKFDKSNFSVWDGENIEKDKESIKKQLEVHIDHINPEATEDDILCEIIIKAGFELTTKVELLNINNKTVYSIDDGSMLVCLDKNLNKELLREIADKVPGRVVFLDEGFKGNDELKTNAIQIMKSKGIEDFKTI